jgi:hypothetical protein
LAGVIGVVAVERVHCLEIEASRWAADPAGVRADLLAWFTRGKVGAVTYQVTVTIAREIRPGVLWAWAEFSPAALEAPATLLGLPIVLSEFAPADRIAIAQGVLF